MGERREASRVTPTEDCIVVHSRKIGSIKNISVTGLYCSCFQDSNCAKNIHREIDILCGHGRHLVKGLKVKIIDSETIAGRFLTNFEVKKCRMQFVELGEEQSCGIETIIDGSCIY
ncbi:MAG: hypothetical protein M8357_12860 [Desulfobulbaceae bacterium]|nr:hypothetical protein [Desulfobulbaceae bacterium]